MKEGCEMQRSWSFLRVLSQHLLG